jgi:SAM-dependent methyltransferase
MAASNLAVFLAKRAMRLFERRPDIEAEDTYLLQEVFNHKSFIEGTAEERRAIMLRSARRKYADEIAYPWDNYFGFDLRPFLIQGHVLDLGCFNGGRTIAWFERYKLVKIIGIDVLQEYVDAGALLASERKANAEFIRSTGEALPFGDNSFSSIVSFDVFEHVQDVAKTLDECYRVLKPGGRLFVVFPSYYQPLEHHLSLVSITPGLQYMFSGKTLIKAYCEILDEREDAYWYKRKTRQLQPWERGNTINGGTFGAFKKTVRRQGWRIDIIVRKPMGSIGRSVQGNVLMQLIGIGLLPMTYIPWLREFCLHRNTFVLEKPD